MSVYSHLGGTEEAQPDAQVAQQLTVFDPFSNGFSSTPTGLGFICLWVFHYPNHQLDAVRCGIGLLVCNAPAWDQLQPVGHLTTSINNPSPSARRVYTRL